MQDLSSQASSARVDLGTLRTFREAALSEAALVSTNPPNGPVRMPARLCLSAMLWLVVLALFAVLVPYALANAATVTVMAEVDIAYERGPAPGMFTFTRTGDVAAPLTVHFTLAGTASRDVDYLIWETRAEFAAGAAVAYVAILPHNDSVQEPDETVVLTLSPDPAYTIGTPSSATVTIKDFFVANFPGVWDDEDIFSLPPPQNFSGLAADMLYLDARISGGELIIDLGMRILTPPLGRNLFGHRPEARNGRRQAGSHR